MHHPVYKSRPQIEAARIEWRDGTPFNLTFNDCYYSAEGGHEESQHVFIKGNRLVERWSNFCNTSDHQHKVHADDFFSIAELGTGTALNFLSTWQTFIKHAPKHLRLIYYSIEKHPLSLQDMERCLNMFFEHNTVQDSFLKSYPPITAGWHTRYFENGRIRATFIFEDVLTALRSLNGKFDAWYLDGFSPKQNPDMWSEEVCRLIAKNTNAHGTIASYTVAGVVKRNLQDAGFYIEKREGFARKREMIYGELQTSETQNQNANLTSKHIIENHPAIVIGGGVAGVSLALSFALRGIDVNLYESEQNLASRGSGNRMGLLQPLVHSHPDPASSFSFDAFLYTLHLIRLLEDANIRFAHESCSLIHIAHNKLMEDRYRSALLSLGVSPLVMHGVDQTSASEIAGVQVNGGGLCFPLAQRIAPPNFCESIISYANLIGRGKIFLHKNTNIKSLEVRRTHGTSRVCGIKDDSGNLICKSRCIVVATGDKLAEFDLLKKLPVRRNRGQVLIVKENEKSKNIRSIIAHEGYITPAFDGVHVMGADYDRKNFHPMMDANKSRHILNMHNRWIPSANMNTLTYDELLNGRVAVRASSLDHLPLVGQVVDYELLDEWLCSATARQKEDFCKEGSPNFIEGLYVLGALGSRGLAHAPLFAECVASMITGEASPSPVECANAFAPARYARRCRTP